MLHAKHEPRRRSHATGRRFRRRKWNAAEELRGRACLTVCISAEDTRRFSPRHSLGHDLDKVSRLRNIRASPLIIRRQWILVHIVLHILHSAVQMRVCPKARHSGGRAGGGSGRRLGGGCGRGAGRRARERPGYVRATMAARVRFACGLHHLPPSRKPSPLAPHHPEHFTLVNDQNPTTVASEERTAHQQIPPHSFLFVPFPTRFFKYLAPLCLALLLFCH